MSQLPTITCTLNGSYLVRGLEILQDAHGHRLEAKPVMALCRCGGSATKPFCDGTHQKNGFSGARLVDGSTDRRESPKMAHSLARIAYGCNVGVFVSGVASGSLHGWLWIVAALPGCWLGIRLRRSFGMAD